MCKLTKTQYRVLRTASLRPEGNVCPVRGLLGSAEEFVLKSLRAKAAEFNGAAK